jgi:hypothetical protein
MLADLVYGQKIFCPYVLLGAALFFLVFFLVGDTGKKTTCPRKPLLRCEGSLFVFFAKPFIMKKISSLIPWFDVALVAQAISGLDAVIDGAITVVSSAPSVLAVTPLGDGTFHVDVVGVGHATLTVSGDADLGDGIKTLSQAFEFEVYDGATEADHFELHIIEFAEAASASETDSASAAAIG